MINKIALENFKCFNDRREFSLSRVNLFTGYNGRGKSSVFQLFLLLSQSIKKYKDIKKLCVNGNFVKLDLFEDIVNDSSKPIKTSFSTDESSGIKDIDFCYEKDSENNRAGKICGLVIDGEDYYQVSKDLNGNSEDDKKQLSPYPKSSIVGLFENFYYIAADRLGPTKYEEKIELNVSNPVGENGQFRLNVINKYNDLKNKISADISDIMDSPDKMALEGAGDENSVLSLFFNKEKKHIKSINTGFGYSYILSIVILLNYVKEGVIFIENPEAHLHPLAQSKLMTLVCKTICNNPKLQIFIETHSEHIINAFRLACVKTDINISNKDISIYFFDKNFETIKLEVKENGQIPTWPAGFFDQQSIDLAEIIKYGLKK